MSCAWRQKITLYIDDELEPAARQEVTAHLPGCSECAAAVAEQAELKKTVRIAGKRFSAPPELHAAIYRELNQDKKQVHWWRWATGAASLVVIVALAFLLYPKSKANDTLMAELVDQHITATASSNPVDVLSTDRHTVKPWFQGKLPFTFNLPEIAGSPFTLVGGKMVYLQQSPGAELLYQVRQHKISVFIFQVREGEKKPLAADHALSFTFSGWMQGQLQYCLVTDATRDEAEQLVTMFRKAAVGN